MAFASRDLFARRHYDPQSVLRRIGREDQRVCGLLIADEIKDLSRTNISIVTGDLDSRQAAVAVHELCDQPHPCAVAALLLLSASSCSTMLGFR